MTMWGDPTWRVAGTSRGQGLCSSGSLAAHSRAGGLGPGAGSGGVRPPACLAISLLWAPLNRRRDISGAFPLRRLSERRSPLLLLISCSVPPRVLLTVKHLCFSE